MIDLRYGECLFRRVWAMPNCNTFEIPPIREMVGRYLAASKISVDPFARNNRWATYTNDLNPKTMAEYHMDALNFLKMLVAKGTTVDLALFDPPYSPYQIKECYQSIGLEMDGSEALWSGSWKAERNMVDAMMEGAGIVLSFGWNSSGMGKKRGYEIIEGLLICHGAGHSDTICVAERKVAATTGPLFKNCRE